MDFFEIDQPQRVPRLAAKVDVGGDVKVVEDIQLLMNERHPKTHGIVDVIDFYCHAINADLSVIGLIHAPDNLHQCGLARPVLTTKRHDFAHADLQGNVGKRNDARKTFADASKIEE